MVGRIGRLTFWIGTIGLFLGLLAYQYLTGGLVLILVGYALWAFMQAALLVKRLHDVNRAGWWALAPADTGPFPPIGCRIGQNHLFWSIRYDIQKFY